MIQVEVETPVMEQEEETLQLVKEQEIGQL
jgi:hypothetical protein